MKGVREESRLVDRKMTEKQKRCKHTNKVYDEISWQCLRCGYGEID